MIQLLKLVIVKLVMEPIVINVMLAVKLVLEEALTTVLLVLLKTESIPTLELRMEKKLVNVHQKMDISKKTLLQKNQENVMKHVKLVLKLKLTVLPVILNK